MRNNNLRIFIVIFILLAALVFFIMTRPKECDHDWNVTYDLNSKEAYGLYILKTMLQSHASEFTIMTEDLKSYILKNPDANLTYINLGAYLRFDSTQTSELLSYVKDGNDAFLGFENFSDDFKSQIEDSFMINSDFGLFFDYPSLNLNSILHNFTSKSMFQDSCYYHTYKVCKNDSVVWPWNYFNDRFFCQNQNIIKPLCFFDNYYVDGIQIQYGKGQLVLFLNPICLSNYYYDTPMGRRFVENLLSSIQTNKILWDNNSSFYIKRKSNSNDKSPLATILQYPSLRWAWYLTLITIVSLLVFGSRLKQAAKQIIINEHNTRLRFLETLAGIFRQSKNNKTAAMYRLNYFQYFIKNNANISDFSWNESICNKIQHKTAVDHDVIHAIISHGQFIIRQQEINSEELLMLEKYLQQFYYQSKIKNSNES